ncbi:helix-turn-helix transcriptional regulator [Staphylococcus sp. SQ8-PEA]|uniref:Helix-turn-helix transcriptional regulator n=1 Tax=Staphylococcus marylandisciuri TaxID=2981529 RepID=A0ABT2QR93_9STAP|nr:helix-turn-helix transcriptional regulator [Staphylococcus marylandisciuri]MCU5746500.1 helix-turn-helix transcriptional regulator [Staphylococcus marylandisciuri]
MYFSDILKSARIKENLSINRLAKLADVSTTYISKLENRKRSFPTLEIIFNITYGFMLNAMEKYSNLENYEDFVIPEIELLLGEFVTSDDSNLTEYEMETSQDEFEIFYQKKEKAFLSKSISSTQSIYSNKIKMLRNSNNFEELEEPYLDLQWLLNQSKYNVFYGRDFLTDFDTVEKRSLKTKDMYYYNTLDESDLYTIKRLIEVYLESKYPKIKNPENFYLTVTDEKNRTQNVTDWYHLD